MQSWKKLRAWFEGHAHGAIAAMATLIGLTLYFYSGIAHNQRATSVFLQDIEQRSVDFRFALRGSREVDPRIVIVGIDEKTLEQVGSFPLPRSKYAQLVRALKQDGARVVAFDMTFPLRESSEALNTLTSLKSQFVSPEQKKLFEEAWKQADVDTQFANTLQDAGNIVLGHLFLEEERAKYTDPKRIEEYLNIILARPFPQVLKVGPGEFKIGTAWEQGGGSVMQGVEPNLPMFAEAAGSFGFFNINPDQDGTLRRALLMCRYRDEDYFPSLDLMALQQFEKVPDQEIKAYISADGLERIQIGSHQLHPRSDGTLLINYVGPYHSYPHYAMVDVLWDRVPAAAFRDKIVLVGATALGLADIRNTPFQGHQSVYMGVEVHANILDNLLHSAEPHRTFLVRGLREELVDFGLIVLFGGVIGVWLGRWTPLTSTAVTFLVLALFGGFVYFSFVQWGRWYSLVVPSLTLLIAYLGSISYRVFFEEREKRKIRKRFGMFLSPGVISLIEKDPEKYFRPGGETRELSVLFSDIRNFTTLSEGMKPDEVVRLLNEYFNAMTEVLYKHSGTLDKFIGDAIMAFWGSPYPQEDHAYRACCCALDMRLRLVELNREWAARGMEPIKIGIGVSSGEVNVGNIGSEKRLSWTVMGDNVNLASRLEGLNKQYRSTILVAEGTYAEINGKFVMREIDRIRVKGKAKPVSIYELLAPIADAAKYESLVTKYHSGLASYRAASWRDAADKFSEVLKLYPNDGPAEALLHRCMEFIEAPPTADWGGVYAATSK
jgi:adenylate cyclase